VKKCFAFLLAVMMMAALAVPVSASTYDPAEAAAEFNKANPNLYWDGTEVAFETEYESGTYARLYQLVRLSDAQKIISLVEKMNPAFSLYSGWKSLRICCDAEIVRYDRLFLGQTEILGDHLTERETWGALSVLPISSAREMMLAIKTLPEYRSDPFVTEFVDSYLSEETLPAAKQVREALKALTENQSALVNLDDKNVDEMNIDELLEFTTVIVKSKAFRDLYAALSPDVVNSGKDIVALKATLSDEELAQAWEKLRDAAEYYQPSYVSWLESFELLMPYGSLGYPSAGQIETNVEEAHEVIDPGMPSYETVEQTVMPAAPDHPVVTA
jgi:hypothetical protein